MYRLFFKRLFDVVLSLAVLIILSPVFIILIICGTLAMRGNPFYLQSRPGMNEKIFRLIKFRTMSNQKDKAGNLLPDEIRLNKYGRFLRSISLDELPELFNILKGDMSIVGPRPLMVRYLPYYKETERKRHNVRPGLTGLAQVRGRNSLTWEERFVYDIQYVENISLHVDISIIFETIIIVFKREGIGLGDLGNLDDYRKQR